MATKAKSTIPPSGGRRSSATKTADDTGNIESEVPTEKPDMAESSKQSSAGTPEKKNTGKGRKKADDLSKSDRLQILQQAFADLQKSGVRVQTKTVERSAIEGGTATAVVLFGVRFVNGHFELVD